MKFISCILLVIFATFVASEKARFDSYKVFTVDVENNAQLRSLHMLEQESNGLDFWQTPIIGRSADIMVSPHKFADFEDIVETLQLKSTLKIDNVQRYVVEKN